jgi:hypothetical protein
VSIINTGAADSTRVLGGDDSKSYKKNCSTKMWGILVREWGSKEEGPESGDCVL